MTTTALSIPAYARGVALNGNKTALTEAASGGVGGKAEFPHLSIKQGRWRLIDVEGTEAVLDSFKIAFAIVSINSSVSKAWYERKYQPGDEPSAPDCYSNNGIVPLPDSDRIQSQQCATCDKNVWGSDVNPNNGNKLKACKDAKHIALMFLNPENLSAEAPEIYAQRLSAMSMINFSNFAKDVASQGGALDYIVVQAEFDTEADFPLIKYSVLRNMTEEEWTVVDRTRNEERATRASNNDQKVIPIMAERVMHVQGRLEAPTGEISQADVEAKRKAEGERQERVDAANKAAKAQDAKNAAADKARQIARAAELAGAVRLDGAMGEKPVLAVVDTKAAKWAAAKAAFEAAQRELEAEGDNPATGADATNVQKVTDVEPKPRQRSPVNVVSPDAANPDMEDLLAAAMR